MALRRNCERTVAHAGACCPAVEELTAGTGAGAHSQARVLGFVDGARCTFALHENLWPGRCPRTPERHFRAPQGGRLRWPVPARARGRTQEPHDRRARATRPADRLPRPAPAPRPPVLPVSEAGRARPSDRDVWMGPVPPFFRPGWGGDSTPAGGTDGVRPGRSGGTGAEAGGDADQVARRSLPRTHPRSRLASNRAGDRPPSGEHPATG